MEFGMSCRIKPKEKYVRISMNVIWMVTSLIAHSGQLASFSTLAIGNLGNYWH